MYMTAFLAAAAVFVVLTLIVFVNYPASWRRNKRFLAVLILWHLMGTAAIICVFTCFSRIPYENIRYEVCRIATFYYVPIILMALLFMVRLMSSRTYQLVMMTRGISPGKARRRWISDHEVHTLAFVFLSFAICAAGYFNIDFLHLQRYEVECRKPSALGELDICLIADIHAGSGTWQYTYDDLAEMINECHPDVLMIAGDVFDETTGPSDVENFAWVLETIDKPPLGIYYIYGNHDSRTDDWAARQMKDMGAIVLEDEMVLLGEDIQLIGCLDPRHHGEPCEALFDRVKPDLRKPVLVLTHRPRHFGKLEELGCDLVMAGHTHGFNIPQFMGGNILGDMYSGIRAYGDMTAVTTSGVGAWGFHYKWPARSEVVHLHVSFASGEEGIRESAPGGTAGGMTGEEDKGGKA